MTEIRDRASPADTVPGIAVPPRPALDQARHLLESVWGYPDFRPGQRRAVVATLAGRDCLAVLPTGAGKSLCYQVPALLLPGLTLVVSPLISLMEDQVAALERRGISAACLSSTQTPERCRATWQAVRAGRIKLLYVAPERMSRVRLDAIPGGVSLLAIDEAHCISEWGHDFRPAFRALGLHRKRLDRPPSLAVTATATPRTRAEIERVLGLERPVHVVGSFDRPNLWFGVRRCRSEHDRLRAAAALLRGTTGSAIVYLPTRERTDAVALLLRRWGFAAAPYHAGLPGPDRGSLLRSFLDGRLRVMVATNAFGMGIDQPDVRVVIHLGIPARPEAYYQEAGRAGRDGRDARCELLWLPEDHRLTAYLARGQVPSGPPRALGHPDPVDRRAARAAARAGLSAMKRYVMTGTCRRRVLLQYLGERLQGCAGCDHCARRQRGRATRGA